MHEGGGRWVGSNKVVELKKIFKENKRAETYSTENKRIEKNQ